MLAVGKTWPDFEAYKMDGGSFEESVVRSDTGLSFFIQKQRNHQNFTRKKIGKFNKRLKTIMKLWLLILLGIVLQ